MESITREDFDTHKAIMGGYRAKVRDVRRQKNAKQQKYIAEVTLLDADEKHVEQLSQVTTSASVRHPDVILTTLNTERGSRVQAEARGQSPPRSCTKSTLISLDDEPAARLSKREAEGDGTAHDALAFAAVPHRAPGSGLAQDPLRPKREKKRKPNLRLPVEELSQHMAEFLAANSTIIRDPNGNSFVELRCYHCGGNSSASNRGFWLGEDGFFAQITHCHRSKLGTNEWYDKGTTIAACVRRHITEEELTAISNGEPGAYIVERITGAGQESHPRVGDHGKGGVPFVFDGTIGEKTFGASARLSFNGLPTPQHRFPNAEGAMIDPTLGLTAEDAGHLQGARSLQTRSASSFSR
ncbi:hypothetical protein LTR78_001736 [Recurvomyces mirabilis]|uniref:Uncharacterized protein n=1 Tax=Recurvomyces mirabilis TaxID=574656 RepID=A0AAE1C574_9PEZI|nr:hypothetical protein LTR78_001736 [Recurvomyces mirabilis]KAK5150189.1 hypothetical protein LTS14_010318 [Recurvomyces mirabilis]